MMIGTSRGYNGDDLVRGMWYAPSGYANQSKKNPWGSICLRFFQRKIHLKIVNLEGIFLLEALKKVHGLPLVVMEFIINDTTGW